MKHLIAIPVFNEERYLAKVIRAVEQYASNILIINDGSTDDTAKILTGFPQVATITHLENRGYGQSLIDAFRFAHDNGYDWVITIDCDEQHEPMQIPRFIKQAERDDVDLISGSRYLQAFDDDDDAPADRRQINMLITELFQHLVGLKITDSFCGFKAHRVSAMRKLKLDEPGYAFPMQFWPQFVRARLKMREIPVRRIYRDTQREFGGTLDDPAARLQHYLEVLMRDLRLQGLPTPQSCSTLCSCQRPQ